MSDVTRASFADSHSFATQHIVNVHKIIVWSNSQVFPLTCWEKRLTTYKEIEQNYKTLHEIATTSFFSVNIFPFT